MRATSLSGFVLGKVRQGVKPVDARDLLTGFSRRGLELPAWRSFLQTPVRYGNIVFTGRHDDESGALEAVLGWFVDSGKHAFALI